MASCIFLYPLFFFLAFVFVLSDAQSCQPYSLNFPSAAICVNRFKYHIFVPAGQTQNEAYKPILTALFGSFEIEGTSLGSFPNVSDQCQTAVFGLICGAVVPGNHICCEN